MKQNSKVCPAAAVPASPTSFNLEVNRYDELCLYLIKPSKYDDDGYVIRHFKGVLPSNTLACLYALSEDVRDSGVLGQKLKWKIHALDETVQRIETKRIIRKSRKKNVKTVICLVGVQSNQFPRAADLALTFRQAGLDVLIGGFHVSGILATLSDLPGDLRRLKEQGVVLVGGEVENHWGEILRDLLENSTHPIYQFLREPPAIENAPVPRIPKNLLTRYAAGHFATLDCGRGCPYQCSFCTVINVQGRRMRFRSVEGIADRIRKNYWEHKIKSYFFTDDNFSRNKNWEKIFDLLIELREKDKLPISFMMQVDTQSYKIANFIEKAGRAGCSQAFIGMESLNETNLKSVGKNQNNSEKYKELIETYQRHGIVTHLAYIIGFPFDTKESVEADIDKMLTLEAEQASFFMMTPLPGSMDYKNVFRGKRILDHDLNNYDSFHETFQHEHLKGGDWLESYHRAWQRFYSVANMKNILKKIHPVKYWKVFYNFIWYKNAFQVEGGHPMVHGFFRLKGRHHRRPNYPVEARWDYFKRRFRDVCDTVRGWIKLALEMEEVWLATRPRSPVEQRVVQEFKRVQVQMQEWQSLKLSELQQFYRLAAQKIEHFQEGHPIPKIKIPSRFSLWFSRWNVFSDSLTFTRQPMTQFWSQMLRSLRKGNIHRIAYFKAIFMAFRETVLFVRFIYSLLNHSGYAVNRSED